jgi:hypothetical protein
MGRGPSYPYVGLEEAIGLTRKVYDFAKRGSAPTDSVITDAWKYSTTSSGAQKMLAAVRAFGLVEDAPGTSGKSLKVSNRAIRILLDEADSSERKEEIRKAALAPKWYAYCWRTWGKEMPPSMRSNLLIEHGFVESTVEGFLKDYRKTIAFAGLLDEVIFGKSDEGNQESEDSFNVGDYVQWESQGVLRMPEAKKLVRFEEGFAFVEGSPTGIPIDQLVSAEPPELKHSEPQNIFIPATTKPTVKGEVRMESFALSEGGFTLQLSWPSSITEEGFEDFVYQLDGLKKKVKRAIQKPIDIETEG